MLKILQVAESQAISGNKYGSGDFDYWKEHSSRHTYMQDQYDVHKFTQDSSEGAFFLRIVRLREKNRLADRFCPFWGPTFLERKACLRSERLLCIRRIAIPFSSVEKSKPRFESWAPVDMSTRLPDLISGIDGRGGVRFCVLEYVLWARLCLWESSFRYIDSPLNNASSWPMSLFGWVFRIYRRTSMSVGKNMNCIVLIR